ncbi:hypothetical protein GCM10020331_025690 [Ectobacillus funiculus]
MELLEAESDMLVGFYFYWVEELCAELQWDRVEHWLSFSYKKLKQYLAKDEDRFFYRTTLSGCFSPPTSIMCSTQTTLADLKLFCRSCFRTAYGNTKHT